LEPILTVLLPVHGNAIYLEESIKSIENQKCNFLFDLLIVLDRPGKTTNDFLKTHKFMVPTRVIESLEAGLVSALNTGLGEISTIYTARIDADDLMNPGRLQKQVDFLNMNPNVAVVGSQLRLIDADGNFLKRSRYPTEPSILRKELLRSCALGHPSVSYRTKSVINVGGYRTFYEYAEDYDLWLRILEKYDLVNLSELLTSYRIHPDQVSQVRRLQQIRASRASTASYYLRLSGQNDLEDQYKRIEEWKGHGHEINTSRYSKFISNVFLRIKQSREDKNTLELIFYLFLLLIFNPKQSISILLNRFLR
jgi:glycosyltransferase involved in cell wall biosynthesis